MLNYIFVYSFQKPDTTSDLEPETLSTDAGNGSSSEYSPQDSSTPSVGSSASISSDSGNNSNGDFADFGDVELQTIVVVDNTLKPRFGKQMQTIYEPEEDDIDFSETSELSELLQNRELSVESDVQRRMSMAHSADDLDMSSEPFRNLNISAAASLGDLANIFGNVHM